MSASLFDVAVSPRADAPRCRMCARSARWNKARQEWAMYCAGAACSNQERICQMCGDPFVTKVDGAGTKYCSALCRSEAQAPPKAAGVACAGRCGRTGKQRGTTWPYTCDECLSPIRHLVDRLKSHHVPYARAMQLAADPTCEICRRKNALMVKVHESKFKLLAGQELLTEYRFHTETARHFFCKVCGIYPFHRKRVTPDNLGINVFCLHDFEPAGISVSRAVGAAMP
jgi:hypothetical protein